MKGRARKFSVRLACLASILTCLAWSATDSTSLALQTNPTKPSSEQAQASGEKHTTPEDRQRLVAIAHKLEASPLDPTLAPERAWAVQWVVAAPDLHVRTCALLLADLRRPRYKYRAEIADQLLISSAVFLIEQHEEKGSVAAQSVSAMGAVLNTYKAILKTDPQATAKVLDDFVKKQADGKLADAVRDAVQGCQ